MLLLDSMDGYRGCPLCEMGLATISSLAYSFMDMVVAADAFYLTPLILAYLQLNAVRRRAEARSLEVEHAVDSVRNEARIEMTTMQAKHRIELQSKGAEIDGLRRELDELLSHMSSLKSRSTVTATRV